MSIPRPDSGVITTPTPDADGDLAGTALIARLAGEFFREPRVEGFVPDTAPGFPALPPGVPTTVAGLPGHLPAVPTQVPTDFPAPPETTSELRHPSSAGDWNAPEVKAPGEAAVPIRAEKEAQASLNGGFPTTSETAPVHPSVVAAEPEPEPVAALTPSGAHSPESSDSYEFGEPRSNGRAFGKLAPEVKPSADYDDRAPAGADYGKVTPAIQGYDATPGTTDLYFLHDLEVKERLQQPLEEARGSRRLTSKGCGRISRPCTKK
ncbi:MAG: hypothetical protein QM796_16785 [Chthoniobacteraceae bacterium]